jgi:hypothetical protein
MDAREGASAASGAGWGRCRSRSPRKGEARPLMDDPGGALLPRARLSRAPPSPNVDLDTALVRALRLASKGLAAKRLAASKGLAATLIALPWPLTLGRTRVETLGLAAHA